jgi:DNA-binding transcriptional MerR regulator
MTIGELAQEAAVSTHTIRFYEREGLLPPPERSSAGYRCYSSDAVEMVRNIRALQNIGFTLRDIAELTGQERILSASEAPSSLRTSAHARILERARDRLSRLDRQLRSLSQMKVELECLIDAVANSCADRGFVLPSEVARLRLCCAGQEKKSITLRRALAADRRRP